MSLRRLFSFLVLTTVVQIVESSLVSAGTVVTTWLADWARSGQPSSSCLPLDWLLDEGLLRSPRDGSWISLTPYEAGLFASIFTDTAPLDQESIDDIPLSVMFSSTHSPRIIDRIVSHVFVAIDEVFCVLPTTTAVQGVETSLVIAGALSVPVIAAGGARLNLVSNFLVVGNSVNLKLVAALESNTV